MKIPDKLFKLVEKQVDAPGADIYTENRKLKLLHVFTKSQ